MPGHEGCVPALRINKCSVRTGIKQLIYKKQLKYWQTLSKFKTSKLIVKQSEETH